MLVDNCNLSLEGNLLYYIVHAQSVCIYFIVHDLIVSILFPL